VAQGQNQTYHTVTPYLIVKNATALIDFLKNAFHGTVTEQMAQPDGRVMHAEVKIGDSIIMMGEAMEDNTPFPAMLYVYMEDTDGAYKSALAAGGTSVKEPVGYVLRASHRLRARYAGQRVVALVAYRRDLGGKTSAARERICKVVVVVIHSRRNRAEHRQVFSGTFV